jgi:hypothetical protein
MKVEIDTEILKILGITADDFVYLYLLHANAYDILSELNLKPNEEDLQSVGLIKLGEKTEDHTVRQMFLDMFQSSFDSMWSELLSHFPIKVYGRDGQRILRARDAHAKANDKSKRKYRSIVGSNKLLHESIVKLLEVELKLRKENNTLGYMRMLQTWINGYTWQQYEDITNDPETGKSRITRQL